jgi:alpha-glucosidase
MNVSLRFAALILAFTTLTGPARAAEQQWSLASPDGKLVATLALTAPEQVSTYPAGKLRLYYRVEHGPEGDRVEVLPWSPLGIVRADEGFVDGLLYRGQTEAAAIDQTYTLAHGKRRVCRSLAREQVFSFENSGGARLEVVVRVADDGLAFRYRFPESSDEARTVTGELTGFRLPAEGRAWMTPYQEASTYAPAYEEYYTNGAPVGTESPNPAGWAFPALFHAAGRWVLLTEAAVDGSYCGCRLAQTAPDGVYRIRFPDPGEGNGQGPVEPSSKLPWATPWRVLIVADSPGGIVESTLVTDLNPPSRVEDTSWIKPGRVAWSWWSDHDSPQDYLKMREFIDLAAEMGWEYFLVDANWTLMNHGDVRQLADYARSKGVGLFLWYNSGGEHNVVTEKPRGCMKAEPVRRFELDLLRRWGIKGVKIDFFQSDKQNLMALYQGILRDAADYRIMVNFHGCTVPRGWERTWPHLMSMEAVRGEECYTFAREYPEKAPAYNTILPFTRNAVGPMDYTPCGFTDDKYPHRTTSAHELALPVVFESGLFHFADRVSAYRELPEAPKAFLRELPVAWDETRYVDGEPGKFVVLARRSEGQWYVGTINGEDRPIRVPVPLRFLGAKSYDAQVIGDGKDPRSFGTRDLVVKPGDAITLAMRPYGGAVIRLVPRP